MKKRILIISYTYPPNRGVGGLRIKYLTKYFRYLGYETIILTSKFIRKQDYDLNYIIQTEENVVLDNYKLKDVNFRSQIITKLKGYNLLNGIINYLKYIYFFPDRYKWWFKYAYPKAEKLLQNNKIDVVISSSYPVVAHFIAAELKKKFKFFWIAEFRDLWTYNHYLPSGLLISLFTKRLEKKILLNVDHIVTVSEPLAQNLKKIHKKKPIKIITNGFDPSEKVYCNLTTFFSITYTGILYDDKRDPTILFKAIKILLARKQINKNKIKIRFYGPKSDWLEKKINKFSLESIVVQHGVLEREEVLKIQAESQLLLLLMYDHPEEKGVYTAKVFEYLNAERPILALGNKNSVVGELLEKTQAGFISNNLEEVIELILGFYNEYLIKGEVSFSGRTEQILKYSFNNLVNRYVSIFP